MKDIGTKRIRKKFETKEYERYSKQKYMKDIGTKKYERNWKQRNMKDIGTKTILKKLERR